MTEQQGAPADPLAGLAADLAAEGAELDALLAGLPDGAWRTPTPAEGWDVVATVAHLAASDQAGLAALRGEDVLAHVPAVLEPTWTGSPADLLVAWRAGRAELAARVAALPAGARVPWFGPAMSARSFLTARLMETWAHGQDVADAVGAARTPTDRLRHVCEIGVRTRGWSYRVRGGEPPAAEVRVELAPPGGGAPWAWGPEDAAERVTGTALGFALLVTQRRHRADTGLVAVGPAADGWLDVAQAFAGPPGPGRAPLAGRPA